MLPMDVGSRRPAPPRPHVAAKPAAPKHSAPVHHAAPAAKHVAVRNTSHVDGFDRTIAHRSFEHGVAAVSRSGSFHSKHVSGSGSVNVLHASVNGDGKIKADLRHGRLAAEGKIGARANLVDAQGHLTARSPLGRTDVRGHANVGAEANARGKLEFDPRHGSIDAGVHGDAFAGARAGVGISHKLGPASGHAGVEGEAGIGVNFDAKAGLDHGKLEAHLNVGAALGLGVDVNVGGSLNVGGAVHGAESVAKKGWHAVTSIF